MPQGSYLGWLICHTDWCIPSDLYVTQTFIDDTKMTEILNRIRHQLQYAVCSMSFVDELVHQTSEIGMKDNSLPRKIKIVYLCLCVCLYYVFIGCWFQRCGLRPSVLGQDRFETKNRSRSWSCRSGVVLWNTVLSRSSSSWSWRTQKLFKYYL